MPNLYYRIEAKAMWTAICNACGKDILDHPDSQYTAYTDPSSVGEVMSGYDGYWACPHCNAPLSDAEVEYRAELKAEAEGGEEC